MPEAEREEAELIHVRLDVLLAEKGMTLAQLSRIVGVSAVNLSILKNGHARALRFSTLAAICDALGCDVGDLLTRHPEPAGPAQMS